jgi:hypothetical protein
MRIIKILFALAVLFFAGTLIDKTSDPLMIASVVLLTALILSAALIPARYFKVNEVFAVTPVKVWQAYIIEKLRRDNAWLMRSSDATKNVQKGSTVYIPQAGDDPTVEVDSTSYPGTPVNREDNDVNYALNIFRTVPHRIPWAEIQDISYDKLNSVLAAHTNTLIEAIGDKMLINWAATVAAFQVATTGADVDGVGNQTGVRKGMTHKDLKTAMIYMNRNDVPKQGRVAVIDDNMYDYFYDSLSDNMANAFNQFANNETGQTGKLHGFDIFTRSAVLNYAAASLTPNAYAATQLATDRLASLCWQQEMVERAQGEIKRFYNPDQAKEYGDLTSAIVKFGGRKKRADNKGVVAIIQA